LRINIGNNHSYADYSGAPGDGAVQITAPSVERQSVALPSDFAHSNASTHSASPGLWDFLSARIGPRFLELLFSGGNIFTGAPAAAGESTAEQQADSADSEQTISKSQLEAGIKKGEIVRLSSDPAIQDRVMAALDKGIETTRAALDRIDHDWDSRTMKRMAQLFGQDVKQDGAREKIRAMLVGSLDAMLKTRADGGGDIFIELSGVTPYVAYVRRKASGHTGQVVMSRYGLDHVDDARLVKTLIHEHAHLGGGLVDQWYVKIGGNGDFYRKARSGGDRVLPPLRLDTALNNPDSIAYAAVVLADNGGSYPDEL
jgi:hypothetical protein